MTKAVTDVLAERRRQIEVEGYTAEHDDEHSTGNLADAAACYALGFTSVGGANGPYELWPWDMNWWKPGGCDRGRLVKAGALILAEIERLDRAASPGRRPCPPHYLRGGFELADVIDAFGLGAWQAQAAQYVFRAAWKYDGANELDDIEKAIELLVRVADGLRARDAVRPAPAQASPAEPVVNVRAPKATTFGQAVVLFDEPLDRPLAAVAALTGRAFDFDAPAHEVFDALAACGERAASALGLRLWKGAARHAALFGALAIEQEIA